MTNQTSEYKVIGDTKIDLLEKKINELAADGWEIAHVSTASGGLTFLGSGIVQEGIIVFLRRNCKSH